MSNETEVPVMAPTSTPEATPAAPPAYFISTQRAHSHSMTIDISRVTSRAPEFSAVFLWLSSLTAADTVRLSITDSGAAAVGFCDHLALLNTLLICSGTLIGVVDHMYMGLDSYFMLACNRLDVSPLGMLAIPSTISGDLETLPEKDAAVAQCAQVLLENGLRMRVLTEEEIEQLQRCETVVLQPGQLAKRVE